MLWVEPTYLHQGNLLTVAETQEKGAVYPQKALLKFRLDQVRQIAQFLQVVPPWKLPRAMVVMEAAQTMADGGSASALLKKKPLVEEPGQARWSIPGWPLVPRP